MRLLIIGGTRFLGRHLAEQALAAGHAVTLLHRGRSGGGLFPEAEHLIAERNGGLEVLGGRRTWDAAVDTSAYVPRHVRSVAERLRGRVGQYQLVSTISVYAPASSASSGASPEAPVAEDAPLVTPPDASVEEVTGETYGGLKVLCEQGAAEAFGATTRCLIARPGLLVGPFDPTDRFTWWVQRIARGGTTLAPGAPSQAVQFIDARDAAAWLLTQAEAQSEGIFNLTGPGQTLTMQQMLETMRSALGSTAQLAWVAEPFLLAEGVAPWTDLPLWLPAAQAGLHRTDIGRALASGLRLRPLAQTVLDTEAWASRRAGAPAATNPAGPPRPPVGLEAAREAALLAKYLQRPPVA